MFNLSETAREVTVLFADLGLKGKKQIRDVWRQKAAGTAADRITSMVERHGTSFVRLR
jgi:hypothetical protein